jgi:prolipoprotein diacylglyceryltransferase
MNVHAWFDIAAAVTAAAVTIGCYFWRLRDAAGRIEHAGAGYAVALVLGAVVGGYAAGTANLWLAGTHEIGRSIVGALAGAIVGVEASKKVKGITGSTGIIFVPGFTTSVIIGRWGCFFSGMHDHTHGIPTTAPWGYDFGDGLLRHPVQLYESAAMLMFLVYALVMVARRDAFFMRNGFYLMVAWYATQRSIWEFYKPYPTIIGPLNLFHLVCVGLVGYAAWMLWYSE